jgi:hypothetical protein
VRAKPSSLSLGMVSNMTRATMLRIVASLCIWAAALGLIGDFALHAQDLPSSALMAVAAASAVAVLG